MTVQSAHFNVGLNSPQPDIIHKPAGMKESGVWVEKKCFSRIGYKSTRDEIPACRVRDEMFEHLPVRPGAKGYGGGLPKHGI